MLRRALDDQRQRDDKTHLLNDPPPAPQSGYGSIEHRGDNVDSFSAPSVGSYEVVEEDDEEEEETEDGSWQEVDEDEAPPPPQRSFLPKLWGHVSHAFMVVANVENLWDTPEPSYHHQQQSRGRNYFIVLFWFVVLASCYALERVIFKVLVDKAGPFRLFAVEMVTATHALLLGMGIFISRCCMRKDQQQPPLALGISIVDVSLMALLDTATILAVFLSGFHVPPTTTVILIQFTLPLTAFLTQFVHPNGRCSFCRPSPAASALDEAGGGAAGSSGTTATATSTATVSPSSSAAAAQDETRYLGDHMDAPEQHVVMEGAPLANWGGLSAEHLWGSLIITLAVLLALLPAGIALADPDYFVYADTIPIRTAVNTLLYASSCIPAAASQLYKEHVFLQSKQPVNSGTVNLLLSVFQFTFASILAPLVFPLQGLGARDGLSTVYPSSEFGENFVDGLRCFFRLLSDDDQDFKYKEDARCDFCLGLSVFYAFAIVGVGVSVDKIINAGATKVMYRGISAGIILAVLTMYVYDMHTPEYNYGPFVDVLHLLCLMLLILGAEVYHRVALQESTFETVYPEVQTFFEPE